MAAPSEDQLRLGLARLDLSLDDTRCEQLLAYLDLLEKWNKTYNLTAVRDRDQMVIRHLLDSLAIVPWVTDRRILDVGSGAGLPGIPLAIACSDSDIHLLDSSGKRTRFLFQVKTALCLDNISVHQARVEAFQADEPFDAILSRAFASLRDMTSGSRHLLAAHGRFLAMKGAYPTQEIEDIRQAYSEINVHSLSIPGLTEQRHLVEIPLTGDQ